MTGDNAVVDEISQTQAELIRTALRMLAHQAVLKACKAAAATRGDALERIRQTVLDERLAATVRVQFPGDADVFFEEIERLLMMMAHQGTQP
jgi:sulfur relay (sulfurtransferase) complex TusBCD TusD component (DsrE family)